MTCKFLVRVSGSWKDKKVVCVRVIIVPFLSPTGLLRDYGYLAVRVHKTQIYQFASEQNFFAQASDLYCHRAIIVVASQLCAP